LRHSDAARERVAHVGGSLLLTALALGVSSYITDPVITMVVLTVAAIDLKTDRQNKKLLMQKWSWVGKGAARAARKEYKRRIEEELDRFERFQLAE